MQVRGPRRARSSGAECLRDMEATGVRIPPCPSPAWSSSKTPPRYGGNRGANPRTGFRQPGPTARRRSHKPENPGRHRGLVLGIQGRLGHRQAPPVRSGKTSRSWEFDSPAFRSEGSSRSAAGVRLENGRAERPRRFESGPFRFSLGDDADSSWPHSFAKRAARQKRALPGQHRPSPFGICFLRARGEPANAAACKAVIGGGGTHRALFEDAAPA